jgi:hypothetical protein
MATPAVFQFGPDQPDDFRKLRPYFLVPLDRPADVTAVSGRIGAHVTPGPPVSDVYVLSHGWHRNFFSAAAAYDRLLSSFSVLTRRRRITAAPGYRPLFLALHWHSDPGEDQWVDAEGRRHLPSFMDNAARAFERPSPKDEGGKDPSEQFTTVFEDIFEHFAHLSSPDTSVLTESKFDPDRNPALASLVQRLNAFGLRDGPNATLAEKITAAWACYQTATPKRRLMDQTALPGRFLSFGAAVRTLIEFLVKVLGIVTLGSLLFQARTYWPVSLVVGPVARWWNILRDALGTGLAVAFIAVALFAIAWIHLARTATTGGGGLARPGRSVSVFRLGAWAYLQLVCAAPIILYSLLTYFMGGVLLGRHVATLGLFDERFGARGGPTDTRQPWRGPRYWLARLAHLPVALLRRSIPRDSGVNLLLDQLDSQLAFWEMQYGGVKAGRAAATFLDRVLRESPNLAGARVHLIGHSFGGLVVSNAVRHLALDSDKSVDTLCLLEGALASGWFEHETTVVRHIRGALACIYSRYDTANGFYYPAANHGRLAAGHVGILTPDGGEPPRLPEIEGPYCDADRGFFASVTTPPELLQRLRVRVPGGPPWIVNVDASRMIYEGNAAAGGGHGDIFKNDVVLLAWAVTDLK